MADIHHKMSDLPMVTLCVSLYTERMNRSVMEWVVYASLAEGVMLCLLVFVAAPLKHSVGWAWATSLMGPIHGLSFVTLIGITTMVWSMGQINGRESLRIVGLAMLPLGAFCNHVWLRRRAEVEQKT